MEYPMMSMVDEFSSASPLILATARARWLNVAEIESLLNPNATVLRLNTSPPSSPPPSGTILLYNRSVTRNYKDDGYIWIKKRNSHKVREDHVKLRVAGKFRVSGCYVHGATVTSLHRRAYHLLNPETGTALYPVTNSSSRDYIPSLVVVHYLDTNEASKHSADLIAHKAINHTNIAIPNTIYPNIMHNNPSVTSASPSNLTMQYSAATVTTNPVLFNQLTMANNTTTTNNIGPFLNSPVVNNANFLGDSFNLSNLDTSQHLLHDSSAASSRTQNSLGLETLDFLWDAVFKEGDENKLEETLANNNMNVNPAVIREMIVGASDDGNRNKMDLGQESGLDHSESSSRNICNHGAEMPNILDFTPDRAFDNGPTNVVISCMDELNEPCNSVNLASFSWHTLAAFVEVDKDENFPPKALAVDLYPVQKLNPYTVKVNIPDTLIGGNRHIFILAVFVESGMDPIGKGIAASIGLVLDQTWQEHLVTCSDYEMSWLQLSSFSQSAVKDRPFIHLLSQMSKNQFQCISEEKNNHDKEITSDLPAPAPHMALVATALSDFPNPPVKAVLPPTTTMTITGPNDTTQTRMLSELSDDSPDTKRIIKEAMEDKIEETVRDTKKRSISIIEVHPDTLNEYPEAASAWASRPSSLPNTGTKGEEVDRHCKIRFVEKLNDVITETESTATQVTDEKLKNMDDDELDDMLDKLLVQIVESLADLSPSSVEIQEVLNTPDKSGFTLLHYAALYNLPSLIPVLLSRGANPDVATIRGTLTPLHLACGAGNTAIVELLVRSGCSLDIPDCFGSYPIDHALRNGFSSIAESLESELKQNNLPIRSIIPEQETTDITMEDANQTTRNKNLRDKTGQDRLLIQSVFSNLSLKDKMIFNMMVKKRRRGKKFIGKVLAKVTEGIEEEKDARSTIDNGDCINMAASQYNGIEVNRKKSDEEWDEHSVDSVVSETERERLDIAMKLMNSEEREEIQRRADNENLDVSEWLLQRHYESMMEVSQNLQNTMTKGHIQKGTGNNAAKVRSLQMLKDQALAGLVMRKNVMKKKKALPAAIKVEIKE